MALTQSRAPSVVGVRLLAPPLASLVPADWRRALSVDLKASSFQKLSTFIDAESGRANVFPPRAQIFAALSDDQVRQLHLPLMVSDNTSSFGTAFTVSIEAAHGVSSGISAADRALTIRTAVAVDAKP